VDVKHEALVRQALTLIEEMEQLALTAPHGTVFSVCEDAIVDQGRLFQAAVLTDAVTRRIELAEKKGRPSASAPVDAKNGTVVLNNADL